MTTETTPTTWLPTEHTWHEPSVLHELPANTVVLLEDDNNPYVVYPSLGQIEFGESSGYWRFNDVESRIAVLHIPVLPLPAPGGVVDLSTLRRLPVESIVIGLGGVAYQLWDLDTKGTVQRWYPASGEEEGFSHEDLIKEAKALRLAWTPVTS
jgi:hypothetical protein